MVFPGRRSICCYACRQRRVKCDATRPACDRRTKSGRTCPGYPDAFAFKAYVGSSQRIVSTSAALDLSPNVYISHLDGVSYPPSPSISIFTPNPPTIPTMNTEELSVSCFMQTHVLIVDESPCGGHLAFLPEFYREKSSDPCLRHSVLGLAHLALFHRHQSQNLWIQARKHYSAALAALAAAIDTKESAVRDDVLASALFLGILLGERRSQLNDHIPGVHALIQARGSASLSGKYGRRLLAWAFNQLQIQAIANNEYGYAHLPSLFADHQSPDSVCQAIKLVSLVSGFCQSIRSLGYVFEEIVDWEARLPKHWKRQLEHIRHGPFTRNGGGESDENTNIWTACFMALITSSIVLFYIHCRDYYPSFFLTDYDYESAGGALYSSVFFRYDIYQRIEQSLNTICSSPVLETNHGIAYNLRWPMSLVSHCGFASAEQVLLCTEALRYTNSASGQA
ncbi:hypothetical protein BDW68DRAFT_187872 [Aspergillus falconensis]